MSNFSEKPKIVTIGLERWMSLKGDFPSFLSTL